MIKPFKRTYIEITNQCNLACNFCPGTSRPKAYMTSLQFEKVIQNLAGYVKHVYFHVLGEPLIHPDLGTLLDIAHNNSLYVNITTNGTLISTVSDLLVVKPAVRQITVSLHSFGHNTVTKSVQEYVTPILDFSKTIRSEQFVSLRMWDAPDAIVTTETKEIFALIEKRFELRYDIQEKLQTTNTVTLAKNVFLNTKKPFDWPDIHAEEKDDLGFCLGLRSQIAILVDGTVIPCCLDRNGDMALGNIFETSLHDIVNGERAQKIIQGFSARRVVELLCKKCTYRNRFNL